MGVENAQEFGDRMRKVVIAKMPMLTSRIHRPPDSGDHGHDSDLLETLNTPRLDVHGTEAEAEWTWPAAEARLKKAFEADGFSGWGYALMRELEAEGKAERAKRGHQV